MKADTQRSAASTLHEGAGKRKGGASAVELDSRLAILQEISLALNASLDPKEVIERILDSSIRYTGATTGSLVLVDEDEDVLKIVASRGLGVDVEQEVTLGIGEGVTGWVAAHGKPLCVPDVRKDKRYVMVKEHIRSELAVPLLLRKKIVGVISVDSTHADNFDSDDIQLLTIVGTQAAQILQNARAFADLRRRTRQDETILEVSQLLGSSLDFEELFEQVMQVLSRRHQMSRGFLVLAQQDTDELAIEVAYGMTPAEIAKGRYQTGEGVIGQVFRSVEPFGVKDVREEPRFLGRTGAIVPADEVVSFMACPIRLDGDAVGVFGATKVFPGDEEFEHDLILLEVLANTLSQAVRIHRAVNEEKAELITENQLLREELGALYKHDNIVGASPGMQRVFTVISSVARTKSTVLIRGESGTGKELIAHAIHRNSPRRSRPFVRVNCAAIPENLLEAELFGHVKGSFTGAIADRTGKFVLADGGTIFLDEIGDMTPVLQAKILRVLQEREVEVVGGEMVTIDVRVIAATHQNLEELIAAGSFREDLYYRLNVVPIEVPPLRERTEDIRLLAGHFIEKLRGENDFPKLDLSPAAMRALLRYSWPGNVRELENAIERAAVLSGGGVIDAVDLPDLDARPGDGEAGAGFESLADAVDAYLDGRLGRAPEDGVIWDAAMDVVESRLIERAMDSADGVQLRAAELLGIHRNTLRKKLRKR